MNVRRDTNGAQKADIQYSDNGISWSEWINGFALPEPNVWYMVGHTNSVFDTIDNIYFRVLGYDATASSLEFDEVQISATIPEPGILFWIIVLIPPFIKRSPENFGEVRGI